MWAISLMALFALVTPSIISKRCECHPQCCEKDCGLVLVLLVLSLIVCCDANKISRKDEKTCNRGAVKPRDPYFLEGEDIVLNCSRRKGSWKKLTFVRGPNSLEVPQKYITKLNSTAIQLRIPNISKEDVDRTALSTSYMCVNKKNRQRCYDSVYVALEYYVRDPVNLTCRDYNFDNMTCTWALGVPEYHRSDAVNVTCAYKNATDDVSSLQYNGGGNWESCPALINNSCRWDNLSYPAPARYFYVKVMVHNPRRNGTKVIEKAFNQFDIVEPAHVTGLKHTAFSRCLELKWKPPKLNRSFVYFVTYKSACSDEKNTKTFNKSVRICDLVPHTRYNISVKGRLITKDSKSKKYVERGHWSSLTNHVAITDRDVIDVNPVTSPGLYDIFLKPLADEYTSLNLYWTPLTECALHDAEDSVTYSVTAYNRTTPWKHPAFMALIDVPESKIINVTLQASNSAGHLNSKRVVTVFPESFGPRPSELIIHFNRSNLGCETMAEVVVRENSSRFLNVSHTLVWCKGMQQSCKKPLKMKELGVNVTTFVFPGNLCDDDYRYGLVTHGYSKGQIVDTGIQWEPCIYQLGKVPDKSLQNVYSDGTIGGFDISWSHYDCKHMNAYITYYQVTYCICRSEEVCKSGKENHSNVSRQYNNFTARDLEAGSKVCVWVRGVSEAGLGPADKPETIEISDQPQSADEQYTRIILAVAVAVAVAVIGFIVFLRLYRKYRQLVKREGKVTLPTSISEVEVNQGNQKTEYDKVDSNTRLIDSRTSGIGTGSGCEYNISQGTECTDVVNSSADQSLMRLFDDKDVSNNLEGYKNPSTFYADESGMYDRTRPYYMETDGSQDDLNRSGTKDHESHEPMAFQSDIHSSFRKISETKGLVSFQNRQEEAIELQSMSASFDNQFISESQMTEVEEESFENFVGDLNGKPDGYKGFDSRTTYLDCDDESEDEVSNVEEQSSGEDFKESEPGNFNISEQSDDKADNIISTDLTAVKASSAIENDVKDSSEPVRQDDSKDWPGPVAVVSEDERDNNSITDSSSSGDFLNEQDVSVLGYKQSKDISSISGSGSIGSIDDVSDVEDGRNESEEHTNSLEIDKSKNSTGHKNGLIAKVAETFTNRNSFSGGSSQGNSGTSTEVPNYIIKSDPDTFKETDMTKCISSNHKSPYDNGKNPINGFNLVFK